VCCRRSPYGDTRWRRGIRHVRPRRSVEVDPPHIHELEDQHRHERLRNTPDPHSAVCGDRAAAGLVTGRGSDDPAGSDDGKDHAARGIGPYESIGPGLEEICGVGRPHAAAIMRTTHGRSCSRTRFTSARFRS
jgi:hypothetical protein